MSGCYVYEIGPSPALDDVALPLKEQVHSLGVLLDPSSFATWGPRSLSGYKHLLPVLIDTTAMAVPRLRELDHSSSSIGNFKIGLLQCTSLVLGLETTVSAKCCSTVVNMCETMWAYNSFAQRSALVVYLLPGQVQVLLLVYKALSILGPVYMWDWLITYVPLNDFDPWNWHCYIRHTLLIAHL